VTTADYRSALAAAIKEYESLGDQRRQIDERLSQLAQTIGTLSTLLGLTPTHPMGLTDACRLVYRNSGVPLSPTDVRDRLRAMGVDLSVYSNEMAAIHTVIKRLNEGGELRFLAARGKQLYKWVVPPRAIVIGPDVAQFIREQGRFHTERTKK
jgi:Tfp pilus assembly protein PilN